MVNYSKYLLIFLLAFSMIGGTINQTAEDNSFYKSYQELQAFPDEYIEIIARTIYGEAGGIESTSERAAVAWCILNRVDAFDQEVDEIVTLDQFNGYIYWGECPSEFYNLALDVVARWIFEKNGVENVGRVLPSDYIYFFGDGYANYYTMEYNGTDYWDWSLRNPYGD